MLISSSEKYHWTLHARLKMKYYGLSESRVKRVIRFPARTEEGIVLNTVAVMQPAGTKRYQEVWAMYKLAKPVNPKQRTYNSKPTTNSKIKIITAWRYPGKSPLRNPVPLEVINEVRKIL